jgi:hypothetical protein
LQRISFSENKYSKRCNYPNSLTDKEKAIISDGFSSLAPLIDQKYNHQPMIEYVAIRKVIC